ncbi:type II toxin-antitoxin system RelE/ParE family toxin [Legionella maioricensis]|uniref:Type II toxin-antitoxin system RelE/ParE family toxin n=1 Tax=Legionella maioricensis TaxID=2896528 RepID=A0A9X2CXI6_9GAMM|nr:type II toxin-antitoxin system RelE/ParE family toxin [Legionella maioricensis]MCL9682574.1 type II toxin-antitoxin system RelE/ParE family toxin [Legionella maioricensis]MCL9686179.1 type II toxin-antitoxin system RelE/ParE family toxin [Legionella maioricensis]
MYKVDKTYRVQSPESIDPEQTNPNAMWVITPISDVGSQSPIVSRILLQGSEILKAAWFEKEIDKDEVIQARMLKLLELIEEHGANLGPPHTDPMGDGLFEIRAKAQEGIGRSLYCYMKGRHIIVLHAFVKKSNKTPKAELNLAKKRKAEVENEYSKSKR